MSSQIVQNKFLLIREFERFIDGIKSGSAFLAELGKLSAFWRCCPAVPGPEADTQVRPIADARRQCPRQTGSANGVSGSLT